MKRLLPTPRTALCRQTQAVVEICRRTPAATHPLSTSSRHNAPPPPPATVGPIVQAMPRGGYYDVLLTNPPPYASARANQPPVTAKPATAEPSAAEVAPAPAAAPPAASTWKQAEAPATLAAQKAAEQKTVQERAALVFGSRLAGPMERANRLAEIRKRSTRIAGVLVPPKPTEPENCCMSGCVNCVWDRFRDEMEEWAAASAMATQRLHAQEGGVAAGIAERTSTSVPAFAVASSMDDDGGVSDANWSLEDAQLAAGGKFQLVWDEELYKGVPVGIREFMKQEKRLKLKHIQAEQAEAASAS